MRFDRLHKLKKVLKHQGESKIGNYFGWSNEQDLMAEILNQTIRFASKVTKFLWSLCLCLNLQQTTTQDPTPGKTSHTLIFGENWSPVHT